jgi:hypothetical protein
LVRTGCAVSADGGVFVGGSAGSAVNARLKTSDVGKGTSQACGAVGGTGLIVVTSRSTRAAIRGSHGVSVFTSCAFCAACLSSESEEAWGASSAREQTLRRSIETRTAVHTIHLTLRVLVATNGTRKAVDQTSLVTELGHGAFRARGAVRLRCVLTKSAINTVGAAEDGELARGADRTIFGACVCSDTTPRAILAHLLCFSVSEATRNTAGTFTLGA